MKISVTHSTIYRYDFPVYLEPHIFRLRPRTNSAQRLRAFDIRIAPTPAGTTECLDQDGNLALNAWFNAPTRELSVTSRFTVEMLRQNPFDYVIVGESLNLPLWYREPLCTALTSYRNDTHVAEAVKQYAKSTAESAQWNTLSFLVALTRQIFQSCPPGDPSLRSALAVGPDLGFAGGILPRPGGFVLRYLPGDGDRRTLRQRI